MKKHLQLDIGCYNKDILIQWRIKKMTKETQYHPTDPSTGRVRKDLIFTTNQKVFILNNNVYKYAPIGHVLLGKLAK